MEKENDIGQYIKDLRLLAGFKTQKELSDISGVSQTTLSRVEAGTQRPLPDTLNTLSKYLKANYRELMTKAGYFDGLPEESRNAVIDFFDDHYRLDSEIEKAILSLSRPGKFSAEFSPEIIGLLEEATKDFCQQHELSFAFTPGGIRKMLQEMDPSVEFKTAFLEILNHVKQKQMYTSSPAKISATTLIPVLGKIRCGVPILDETNWAEQIQPPDGIIADFAARAEGDSMVYAGILSGDIILFRENADPYNGQVVATRHVSETEGVNLKYFIKKNGRAVLRSANPEYADIELNEDHQVIGIMVGLIRESAPSVYAYDAMLSMTTDINDRWLKTLEFATANGVTPEAIENMINMHLAMIANITKKK